MIKPSKAQQFRGLNNKEDRDSLSIEWLETADDVDVDNAGHIRRCPGTTETLTAIADGYSTRRGDRAYLIGTDGALSRYDGQSAVEIYSDVGEGPYAWTEYGTAVYLLGNERALEIRPGEVVSWGVAVPTVPTVSADTNGSLPAGVYQVAITYLRDDGIESGSTNPVRVTLSDNSRIVLDNIPTDHTVIVYCSPPNGKELYMARRATGTADTIDGDYRVWTYPLRTQFLSPPPLSGHAIEAWDGQLWVAVYDDLHHISRLFPSVELRAFNLDAPMDVAGKVTLLAAVNEGLIVGTDREIHIISGAEDGGYFLQRLANYGVISGSVDWQPDNKAVFWTERGAVRAMPLEPLTEAALSVAPGITSPGLVREDRGYRTYLTSPDSSGVDHNPYGTRLTPTTVYDATS